MSMQAAVQVRSAAQVSANAMVGVRDAWLKGARLALTDQHSSARGTAADSAAGYLDAHQVPLVRLDSACGMAVAVVAKRRAASLARLARPSFVESTGEGDDAKPWDVNLEPKVPHITARSMVVGGAALSHCASPVRKAPQCGANGMAGEGGAWRKAASPVHRGPHYTARNMAEECAASGRDVRPVLSAHRGFASAMEGVLLLTQLRGNVIISVICQKHSRQILQMYPQESTLIVTLSRVSVVDSVCHQLWPPASLPSWSLHPQSRI